MMSSMAGGMPTVNLSPTGGSFPFLSKQLSLTPSSRILLGSEVSDNASERGRRASVSNGWFAPKSTEDDAIALVSPLPLSTAHAELWISGGKVYIHDLDSPFGTYVNDVKITKATALRDGDTIRLGSTIARNSKTPAYITDDHLRPVVARVSLLGVS
ncbi:hypothetical protein BDQ12DRAFT_690373 [Crucibulum laeve]|uniref:FHA domain-containing protein n=1 Tax=Crucibulum laeve TaxID=68775 RepID=A0A5C3LLD9_9AGAR|nr:hypothetical protein BDQ12DRAFT_690373 [Crucibulum laeve]